MLVLLAGASGFLGTALRRRLADEGHQARRLVRGDPKHTDEFRWDPAAGVLPAESLAGVDAIVNLAGAPIAHWPWTASYRKTLLESRLTTTRTIADSLDDDNQVRTWINASAVGLYGRDRGDEELDETASRGEGFLADVVDQWEGATEPAPERVRVVLLRSGVVLDRDGGALALMRWPFWLGVGGRLGDGRQWFPTISLDDWLGAVARVLADASVKGPVNLVAPQPATNADLTRLLGRIMGRPTFMRVPRVVVEKGLGELSAELLGSLKVHPRRLLEAGFTFRHPDLESQLRAALHVDRQR